MTTTQHADYIPAENKCVIAYYRVSTVQQGNSGLGLDAQRDAVERYASARGYGISAEFTEVETGTNKRTRPVLAEAIAAARTNGCKLVIAKLDRLARSVSFISALMDGKVDFVACDMPDATPLTVHIMAAMAEHEAKMISARTKAALDAKLARDGEWRKGGFKSAEVRQAAAQASLKTRRAQTKAALSQARFTAQLLRSDGDGYKKIALKLNEKGYTTSRGKSFSAMTVKRMLA